MALTHVARKPEGKRPLGSPEPRPPLTPAQCLWHRLKNGCTVDEAIEGLGYERRQVVALIRENPRYAEAYRLGQEKRLEKYARREAEREVECMLSGVAYRPRGLERVVR